MKGDEKLRMRNGDSMKGRRKWFAENLGWGSMIEGGGWE